MKEFIYDLVEKSDQVHWWYRSRNKIFYKILRNLIINKDSNISILDFGSGNGSNLNTFSKFGKVDAYEKNLRIRNLLKKKFKKKHNVKIIKKINKKYDLIIATDVIEHIKDDFRIIKFLRNFIKDNKNVNFTEQANSGMIFMTVPAFPFLYSAKDIAAGHHRRYTKISLRKLISKSKLKIVRISYFNSILFLPLSILIMLSNFFKFNKINQADKAPHSFINYILYKFFSSEKLFINKFNFFFGISLLAIIKK
jgi:2-polyprenyl-3-methyl-5-hydroxy-6-metoxy-1,4-benzoquinol methylase